MILWTDACELHRPQNESEKRESFRQFGGHLEAAKHEHNFYQNMQARSEKHKVD